MTETALSVATGEGADGVASAAGTEGQLFQAEIPEELIRQLEKAGLLELKTVQMGSELGREIRFFPEAAELVVDLLGKSKDAVEQKD